MSDAEQWVSSGIAYMVIGDEFARRMACGPQEGRKTARDELMCLLELGQLAARASEGRIDFTQELKFARIKTRQLCEKNPDIGGPEWLAFVESPLFDRSYGISGPLELRGPMMIPNAFWKFCGEDAPSNWALGSFYGRSVSGVHGVEFALSGLPFAEAVRAFLGPQEADAQATKGSRPNRPGGRPTGPAWPSFVAELVAYLQERPNEMHEQGAVSRIAAAVLERLAEAGKPEPAESSVRDVVSAVLQRCASQGRPSD